MSQIRITRQIGIDAGHRVQSHAGRCRNLHGHRYEVHATITAPSTIKSGPSEGMVLDFGFLKELMMQVIDEGYDHKLILCDKDPLLMALALTPSDLRNMKDLLPDDIPLAGFFPIKGLDDISLVVVPFIPTAENLATHWFLRLRQAMKVRQSVPREVELVEVIVYETPNCRASYSV